MNVVMPDGAMGQKQGLGLSRSRTAAMLLRFRGVSE